jgi:hypothetical protein
MQSHIVAAFLVLFSAFSNVSHAGIITDVASLLMEFNKAGFQAPIIDLNETETTFDLSIQGKLVDHTLFPDDASFTQEFDLSFWKGHMTFSQTDGILNPDTVTAAITIFHKAGNERPHPGDVLKGHIFTFPATTLKQGDPAKNFAGTVAHPANHFDTCNGSFSVDGSANNINGWSFTTTGVHAVPEPSSVVLFAIGFIGYACGRRKKASKCV